MAKQRFNRLHKPKKPATATLVLLVKNLPYPLLIFALIGLFYVTDNSDLFEPEISFTIDANLSESDKYYKQLIYPLLQNKYLISLADIKHKLEQQPWVEKATVSRLFWNKIHINLKAHTITMRFKFEGFISDKGKLFKPIILIDSEAPIAVVEKNRVGQFYLDYLQYQSVIEPLVITHFERSQIDKLTIEPNVSVILGSQRQLERLKHFVKAFKKLKKTSSKIRKRGVFDMRYPKGFALSYAP